MAQVCSMALGEVGNRKETGFCYIASWLQPHTKQPRNSQPEGAANSTPTRREGQQVLPVAFLSGFSASQTAAMAPTARAHRRASVVRGQGA